MRHDRSDGGSHEKRLNTEIDQARHRRRGVICVQRTENKVTSETCVRSNARCLEVSNFANHDDVRRLAQNRAQGCRKGHPNLGIHLDLIDARHLILDRLFHCDDFAVWFVNVIETGVEGGGFSGPGRAR